MSVGCNGSPIEIGVGSYRAFRLVWDKMFVHVSHGAVVGSLTSVSSFIGLKCV